MNFLLTTHCARPAAIGDQFVDVVSTSTKSGAPQNIIPGGNILPTSPLLKWCWLNIVEIDNIQIDTFVTNFMQRAYPVTCEVPFWLQRMNRPK